MFYLTFYRIQQFGAVVMRGKLNSNDIRMGLKLLGLGGRIFMHTCAWGSGVGEGFFSFVSAVLSPYFHRRINPAATVEKSAEADYGAVIGVVGEGGRFFLARLPHLWFCGNNFDAAFYIYGSIGAGRRFLARLPRQKFGAVG
jgi:hypothetical protein